MDQRPRVALATAAGVGDGDRDAAPLRAALDDLGVDACPTVWDDPAMRWGAFDLVLVRSTWDYPRRRAAFLTWAREVAAVTDLANPLGVLEWNTDKHYLADLAAAGVPTVPTTWVPPGVPFAPPGEGEYVVKPSISAGSKDTARYGPGDREAAADHVAGLHAQGRTAMIQPYLQRMDVDGETAVIHLGGAFSHAVRKGPLLRRGAGFVDALYAPEDIQPRQVGAAVRGLAAAALAASPGDLLYARVDLAPGPDGEPVVLEVEVTEPSLFLPYGSGAAERLAGAVADRLRRRRALRGRFVP